MNNELVGLFEVRGIELQKQDNVAKSESTS